MRFPTEEGAAGGDSDAARSHYVRKFIDRWEHGYNSKKKRSPRPNTHSSLDVEVEEGDKLTRPPLRADVKRQQYGELPQQQQQRDPRNVGPGWPNWRTRTRRYQLPKYDFSKNIQDLERLGLSQEEIQKALHADPDVQAITGGDKDWAKKMKSKYYRDKNGDVFSYNDHPKHLKAMMAEGIPVKQWLIVLVLLGASWYYLGKVLSPEKAEKSNPKQKVVSPKKKSAKVGKPKGKKQSFTPSEKSSGIPQSVPAPPIVEETSVMEPDNGKKNISSSDEKNPKASKKKRKAPKQKAVQSETTAKEMENTASQSLAVPSTDTDGSLMAQKVEEAGCSAAQSTLNGVVGEAADLVNNDEWKTVGGSNATEKSQRKNGSTAQEGLEKLAKKEPANEVATTAVVESTAAAEKKASEPKASKATNGSDSKGLQPRQQVDKAKPVANVEVSKPVATPAKPPRLEATTQDDEALALKLQQEEEKLAAAYAEATSEDTWAEVAPKKSKAQKHP